MLEALHITSDRLPEADRNDCQAVLRRAAEFLCTHKETHGHIANHLAGGALSLYKAAELFSEPRFTSHADVLIATVLAHQSSEGWFTEYEGGPRIPIPLHVLSCTGISTTSHV